MNRRDLVQAIAERTELDRKSVDAALAAFVDVVTESVKSGDPVAITGFAKFARVDRPERMGRNPATQQPMKIAAKSVVKITPLKAFKDAVLAAKPAKK